MKLSRRRTLIGLGTLTAGGFVASSVAFTSVDADRSVTVEFEDDDQALLAMVPAFETSFLTFNDDGVSGIEIIIEQVNRNARTRIDDLIEFTNNGTNEITELSFDIIEENSVNGELQIPADATSIGPIAAGGSAVGLSLQIETRESEGFVGAPDIDASVLISAVTDA